MTRWYPLEPADADFLASAPHVFRYQKRFAAPPEQVWESLTSDASVAAWTPAIKEVTWTSPRPFGVGTTREVAAPALARVRERFFRWDEGSGYSFWVYESTLRLFTRFAEDYVVEPDGDGTSFTWTVAIEPKGRLALPVKVLAPALKAGFGRIPSDGQRYCQADVTGNDGNIKRRRGAADEPWFRRGVADRQRSVRWLSPDATAPCLG